MTYDEGTVDTLANALPIHEQLGFPGHVDVVAGQLGRPRNCINSSLNGYMHMSADELKVLISKGWGVGNHSWSHYMYPISPGLDLYREVVWSKYRLEDAIEYPVRVFTIPNDTFNYEPVIELVRQYYSACVHIEGAPNRDGFDMYKIGNIMVGSDGFRPRPGWPEQLRSENLAADFLRDSWLLETSHLCMWDAPQAHKCVTPTYMSRRFARLMEISDGKLWAARPDDVIDYELTRRSLSITDVHMDNGVLQFSLSGIWPVGIMSCRQTFRISAVSAESKPRVRILTDEQCGAAYYNQIYDIVCDGNNLLLTADAVPGRTFEISLSQ